jgi:hypothetical protein
MRSQMLKTKKTTPSKIIQYYVYMKYRVTVVMKMDFIEKVKKLSNDGLTKMVHKVQELMANSITDLDNDKI